MDVTGLGSLLDLEEANGERFVQLAVYLDRLSDGALTRIDARDRRWAAALDQVVGSREDWVGRYGDAFRDEFDQKGRAAADGVGRGRDAFVALGELARTARRIGEAIEAAHLDHRNRLQAALGVGNEWVQRGWTNAQDLLGDLPGPLGGLGESDEEAERTRRAMDEANRSREAAEEAVRAQLQAWNAACQGAAASLSEAIADFRAALPDPEPPAETPWWRRHVLDPLILDKLHDARELLRMTFTPEAMRAIAETLGGLAMIAGGVAGEGGGLALDATGVGAVAGVPINIASAALIGGGAALATKGLVDYATAIERGDYSYKRRGSPAHEPELPKADPIGDEARYPDAHTGEKHVGRSDRQLSDRLSHEMGPRWRAQHHGETTRGASTYRTNADAQRFTQRVFDARRKDILKWLEKAKPGDTQPFEADCGEVTGRHLSRDAWQKGLRPREVTGAKVVLRAEPNAPGGFYTLTSFPIP